ncbi:MAG: hypothetical protein Q9219_007336 [cf. Caloplaca sp. 3 TL-2023]
MSIVGLARRIRSYSTGPSILYLFTGIIEVSIVLLAFIGTLIYASVIYHRHRHNMPYHRSNPYPPADSDRYKGPFADPTIVNPNYTSQPPHNNNPNRDSASAPELGHASSVRKSRLVGELDVGDTEIQEMEGMQDGGVGKGRWALRRDGGELEGEMRVFELSATRSLRGGELEGDDWE